jgi:hypothetical protein
MNAHDPELFDADRRLAQRRSAARARKQRQRDRERDAKRDMSSGSVTQDVTPITLDEPEPFAPPAEFDWDDGCVIVHEQQAIAVYETVAGALSLEGA